MSSPVVGNSDLAIKLMKAFGLPKHTKWFELRFEVDSVVEVKCGFYPNCDSEEVETIFTKYELVKKC